MASVVDYATLCCRRTCPPHAFREVERAYEGTYPDSMAGRTLPYVIGIAYARLNSPSPPGARSSNAVSRNNVVPNVLYLEMVLLEHSLGVERESHKHASAEYCWQWTTPRDVVVRRVLSVLSGGSSMYGGASTPTTWREVLLSGMRPAQARVGAYSAWRERPRNPTFRIGSGIGFAGALSRRRTKRETCLPRVPSAEYSTPRYARGALSPSPCYRGG